MPRNQPELIKLMQSAAKLSRLATAWKNHRIPYSTLYRSGLTAMDEAATMLEALDTTETKQELEYVHKERKPPPSAVVKR
jgi:hypothetical protein